MMNVRRGGDKMSKKYDELLHTLCIYDSVEKVPYEGCIFLKDGKIANVEKGSIKKNIWKRQIQSLNVEIKLSVQDSVIHILFLQDMSLNIWE